ncbi:YopX family protein [Persephonella sp.]
MREIKFRAWLKETKEMIEVDDIRFLKPLTINTTSAWRLEDEIVLMQYTGLKDRNVREIYEGDILQRNNGSKYVVVFENGCFKLKPIGKHSEISTIAYAKHEPIEIIGNIYENPDLLKEETK